MNFLTQSEREQLKLQHRRERDGRIRDRIKAVLLYDEGWSPRDIARVLLISDEAVRNHIDEYQNQVYSSSIKLGEHLLGLGTKQFSRFLRIQFASVRSVIPKVSATFFRSPILSRYFRAWVLKSSEYVIQL